MISIWTDGGARSNPGPAGIGVVAKEGGSNLHEASDGQGEILFTLSEYLGTATNNFAEYTAVIRALETCVEKKLAKESLAFFLDSKLVVEQVQGNWKVKEATLQPLVARVRELATEFHSVSYTHIPRAQNAEADQLANEAMDRGMGIVK
jgi:ribonuclease H / adenosylcobalamin/alpha-ribazole phosphatase